jgi:alcohol dehydrogenase YqhD (iron-dependent ADH family)
LAGKNLETLVQKASFADYLSFYVEGCWAIHKFGHQSTAFDDVDHGASMSTVAPAVFENQSEVRKVLLAKKERLESQQERLKNKRWRSFHNHKHSFQRIVLQQK